MDRIIKLNSNQGGPFSDTSNLIDFDIPSNGSYDFTDSFVTLNSRVTTTDTNPGIYNFQLVFNGDNSQNFYNVALVKNCSLRAGNAGILEDVSRVDVLRSNLNEYTLSMAQKDSLEYKSLRQVRGPDSGAPLNIFREFHGIGSVSSRDLTARIQIPLSQLFDLGKLSAYPASRLGVTRLHLELNIDKIKPAALPAQTTPLVEIPLGTANQQYNSFTVNSNVSTPPAITDLNKLNLWVGRKVTIAITGSPTGSLPVTTTISSISQDGEGGTITITTAGSITGPDTPAAFTPTLTSVEPTTPNMSIHFDRAEITLRNLVNPPKAPSELTYSTFTTEQFSGNNERSFQRMFQLEPSAVNVFLMFPQDVNALKSMPQSLNNYRLRLNNQDLTDRKVIAEPPSPLHYDRLSMTFLNGNMPVKCLNQRNFHPLNTYNGLGQLGDTNNIMVAGNPVPMTQNEKLLQVNLDYQGGSIISAAPLTVTTPGTGYKVGDRGPLLGGSGTGARYAVNTVGTAATGDVATFTITFGGNNYENGDTLTLGDNGNGAADFTLGGANVVTTNGLKQLNLYKQVLRTVKL